MTAVPLHFDRAELARKRAEARAEALAAIDARTDCTPEHKILEIAALGLQEAMSDLIIAAKEAGIAHEVTADVAGAALGCLAGHLVDNYRCDCVAGRVALGFARTFERIAGGAEMKKFGQYRMSAREGGNA